MRHNQVALSAAPHESVDEPQLISRQERSRSIDLRRLTHSSYITVVAMLMEMPGRSRRVFVMMVTPLVMIMLIKSQLWRQIPLRMLRVLLTSGVV